LGCNISIEGTLVKNFKNERRRAKASFRTTFL
jgi:hypothetical protein